MSAYNKTLTAIGRFVKQEDGAISIEAAIMLPLLGIAYVAGFAYFDTYRREAILTKSTYTVADILSRERGVVTPAYLEGLQELFEFLTFSEGKTWMRFTEIQRDGDDLVIHADGINYATDGRPVMTQARLNEIRHRIPRLVDKQYIVLTESFTTHTPVFDIGLLAREFPRIAPTRNRSVPSLVWDDTVQPVAAAETPFDVTTLEAPTIELFDAIALAYDPPADTGGGAPGSGFAPVVGSDPADQPGTQPGQSGSAPGQSGTTPGQSGTTPGQSASAPGQSGSAPGQSGTTPGQSGTTPGQSGSAPGQSASAPGQSGSAPGQSGSAPGQSGTANGQTNSGQNNGWGNGDQTAPGNSGPNNNAENSNTVHQIHGAGSGPEPAQSSNGGGQADSQNNNGNQSANAGGILSTIAGFLSTFF